MPPDPTNRILEDRISERRVGPRAADIPLSIGGHELLLEGAPSFSVIFDFDDITVKWTNKTYQWRVFEESLLLYIMMDGSREWLAGVWFSLEMITISIASSSFLPTRGE